MEPYIFMNSWKKCKAKNLLDIPKKIMVSDLKSNLFTCDYIEKHGITSLTKMGILHE